MIFVVVILTAFAYALISATLRTREVTDTRVYSAIYFVLGGIFVQVMGHFLN